MPKVKFDKQQIKQLLKERVELVAVGVAGFLMVVFLGIGLAGLFGSSSPDGKIVEDSKKLRQRIDSAPPPEVEPAPKTDDKAAESTDGKEPPKDGAKDPPKENGKDEPPKEAARKLPDYAPLGLAAANMFPARNWYDLAASGDTKRREPRVLPLDFVTAKWSQIDVVLRSAKFYTLTGRGGKELEVLQMPGATLAQAMPTEDVRGTRLVVVHAMIPFKEQLEQFRKALRLETVDELLRTGQVPTVARLSVWRATIRPDGKPVVLPDGKLLFTPVYDVFAKDDKRLTELRDLAKNPKYSLPKLETLPRNGGDKEVWVISEPVQKLLREAVYDEMNLQSYGHALAMTGSTPLPRLGHGRYPKLDLDGIKSREETTVTVEGEPMGSSLGPVVPMGGGPVKVPMAGKGDWVRPEGQSRTVDLKKYGGLFGERVGGKINYFSPYGVYLDPAKDAAKAQYPTTMPYPGMQKGSYYPGRMAYPMGMGKDMGMPPGGEPGVDNSGVAGGIPERLVVRFVDAGVDPGHSYQYYVTVWLENPNLGKKEVAYPKLAEVKEIPSPGAYTPWVTVPDDYRFYVVNEKKTEMKSGLDPVPPVYDNMGQFHARIPVQVHQWTKEAIASKAPAGPITDWVIAERLLFARGEEIQRAEVEIEAAAWNKLVADFEMGYRVSAERKGSSRNTFKKTLPIHFSMEGGGPVVVDFAGALRPEDGNLEVLVLTRDGRLMVRNSRDDSDPTAFTGKDRLERLEAWKTRLREVRAAAQAATTTDPMSPMDPMRPMGP
jgi:hypothetical protein